jgi:2'-5' RNA ligase
MTYSGRNDVSRRSAEHVVAILLDPSVSAELERIRSRFDPLAELIPAHVTLVHPFMPSAALARIESHLIGIFRSTSPFTLGLSGVSTQGGEYIYLNVIEGAKEIVDLRERLYTGPMAAHRRTDIPFIPHLTLGRLNTPDALHRAASEIAATSPSVTTGVAAASMYRIDDNRREVVLTLPLEGSRH